MSVRKTPTSVYCADLSRGEHLQRYRPTCTESNIYAKLVTSRFNTALPSVRLPQRKTFKPLEPVPITKHEGLMRVYNVEEISTWGYLDDVRNTKLRSLV